MTDVPSALGLLAPVQNPDFSSYGEVESVPLSRNMKLTGKFLGRNWVTIPHVTHQDSLDITELETFRKNLIAETGEKINILPFLVKAVTSALAKFPVFNASIDLDTNTLILKKYVNVGVAVDTPNGLLVPVVRGTDKKSLTEIGGEISELASRAREKGLPINDMVGGCFTVSSLGALGGTGFTPIINAPEVAILGVSRSEPKPVPAEDGGVAWRTVLPVSLSYDHRVINGADAGRFLAHLGECLLDPDTLNAPIELAKGGKAE